MIIRNCGLKPIKMYFTNYVFVLLMNIMDFNIIIFFQFDVYPHIGCQNQNVFFLAKQRDAIDRGHT